LTTDRKREQQYMLRVNIKHSKANTFREERKKAHWPGEKFLQKSTNMPENFY